MEHKSVFTGFRGLFWVLLWPKTADFASQSVSYKICFFKVSEQVVKLLLGG